MSDLPAGPLAAEASIRDEIYRELCEIRLIDPHTHINPHQPASTTLADILGYHYYTELAHSAGMPKSLIEAPDLPAKELVGRIVEHLGPLENTAQYGWLIDICRTFFGFDEDRLHVNNWEPLFDRSESIMSSAQWPQMVLDQSNVQALFLTNDFDDALDGFDTDTYIPCLRTDDLVFHLADPAVRGRLAACTQISLDGSLESLRASLRQRFTHFVGRGARACAISLPPDFTPTRVADGRAKTALDAVLLQGRSADRSHLDALSRRVFWTLAELCDEFGLPFDLMIGVNRGVYADGVHQGRDLYDSRVSLIQYRELFNAFPTVKFPVSVLASVTNQELVSYAWIFPNVICNGHWWYSNTPSFIARDSAARLEAVPQTKQIGYYSDAYKLEFIWPKFDMYRRVLSGVLAESFVADRGWSVERAVMLGRRVLRDNVEDVFPIPAKPLLDESNDESHRDAHDDDDDLGVVSFGTREILDEPTVVDERRDRLVDDMDDVSLADLPTVVDRPLRELDPIGELDVLPNDDELQELGIDDVELIDSVGRRDSLSDFEAELDPEPLDVGNLLSDDDTDLGVPMDDSQPGQLGPITEPEPTIDATPPTTIRPMTNDESFSPDEDSLRAQPDPLTGELTLPVPDSTDADESDEMSLEDWFDGDDEASQRRTPGSE